MSKWMKENYTSSTLFCFCLFSPLVFINKWKWNESKATDKKITVYDMFSTSNINIKKKGKKIMLWWRVISFNSWCLSFLIFMCLNVILIAFFIRWIFFHIFFRDNILEVGVKGGLVRWIFNWIYSGDFWDLLDFMTGFS